LQEESSVLRLFGFLVLVLIGAGGILFIDFNRTVQQASAAEAEPPSFEAYLETVPGKLASLTASTRTSSGRLELADMLPRAPDGWTARPLAEGDGGDMASFLPRSGTDGDAEGVDLVESIGKGEVPKSAAVAIHAYERGERRVVVQLVRFPDEIFTGLETAERRHELEVAAAALDGRPFMTVRGLDVTEEFLGEGMRARYFTADVGAQIRLRVLASRRLQDDDLVPFFTTLNVKAMNADVTNPQPGLGEVPVLVLGSALGEADRATFEADRAARSSAAIRLAGEVRDAALAELAAQTGADGSPSTAPSPKTPASACKTVSGVKRCSLVTDG
jgi:hypothetical protein